MGIFTAAHTHLILLQKWATQLVSQPNHILNYFQLVIDNVLEQEYIHMFINYVDENYYFNLAIKSKVFQLQKVCHNDFRLNRCPLKEFSLLNDAYHLKTY